MIITYDNKMFKDYPDVGVHLSSHFVIENATITIHCYMDDGYPDWLTDVVWYKDGSILMKSEFAKFVSQLCC